uniref:Leucine-rich repeat protein n=1 Tax=Syphacia muris TaxID=451379 RepID=A0A0N5AH92_9BILA
MKLQCNVLVQNSVATNDRRRPSKGILSLGKGKLGTSDGKVQLCVSTPKDVRGRLFEVNKDTVLTVQKKFLSDGRATIQLRNPPVNIFISEAIPEALKRFVTVLGNALDGKTDVLDEKSDVLHINGLNLSSVDSRWFGLIGLKCLDLSHNWLGRASSFANRFQNIVRLRNLEVLILAYNDLSNVNVDIWQSFPVSLTELDLSYNNLQFLSPFISRLGKLIRLNVSNNQLISLPDEVCYLRNLRYLDMSFNQLNYVPGCLGRMRFDFVDFSYNEGLASNIAHYEGARYIRMSTLLQISAAAVEDNRLSNSHLPWDLRFRLHELTSICSRCLRVFPKPSTYRCMQTIDLLTIASTIGRAQGSNVAARSNICPSCREKCRF